MFTRSAFVAYLMLTLPLWLAACTNSVAPDACQSDADCAAGRCIVGECTVADRVNLSCQNDFDCDAAAGERCVDAICQSAGAAADQCNLTADCALDTYCNSNTGACQPLLEGWCRENRQCTAPAAICTTQNPGVPGRCVECVQTTDCDAGFVCVQPGICEAGGAVGGRPGDSSSDDGTPVPGGGGTDGSGTDGSGTGSGGGGSADPCEQADAYGDGTCDLGCPQPDPDGRGCAASPCCGARR
jgi:uncharacterized membrane protein YgcG